jgi:type I restriction enzyme R subunit
VKKNRRTVAELIQNNVRKLIIDERPINPKYFDKMSELLDALVEKLRLEAIEYEEYLKAIADLAKQVADPNLGGDYPAFINTAGKRALYDHLMNDEGLVLEVEKAIRNSAQDNWRSNHFKRRRVEKAVLKVLEGYDIEVDTILELVKVNAEF